MGSCRNTGKRLRRGKAVAGGLWLVAGVLLVPLAAAGQPTKPANPEKEAVALVKQAIPLQQEGRHEEALVLFTKAANLSSHPKMLFLKARSQFALKRFDDARTSYRMIPQKTDKLAPKHLEEVKTNLAICEEMLTETLVHFVTPGADGASVTVDNEALGPSPVSKKLRKGTYQVRAVKDDFELAEKVLSVKGEDQLTVTLALKPIPVEPPPPPTSPEPRAANRDLWAWLTLGTGAASLTAGAFFLANYADKTGAELDSNQHVEGETIDLGAGIGLAAAGLGLGITSIFLFMDDDEQEVAGFLVPSPGGALVGFRWRGF